jgi:alpha-L-fucosidase
MNRRNFMQVTTLAGASSILPFQMPASANNLQNQEEGNQRLEVQKLQTWEALGFGMFIHFGMSTFDGEELSKGDKPSTLYAPQNVDTDQWIRTARDAGMKYAVLTTKHVSGHCLWPSKYTDYNVSTSGNKTNVVQEFVSSCNKYGIMPGFYYCSWDNHHIMGSGTPSYVAWSDAYTSEKYREFMWNQMEELLSQFGKIGEVWIDIPGVLPRDYRQKLYNQMAKWQPESVIVMNHGMSDGSEFKINYAWPSDVVTIERFLPNSQTKHVKLRMIEGKEYYLPGEVNDPIGKEWFFKDGDVPRSDAELLGMYLVARSRGTNLLLNVPPDKSGVIPKMHVDALMKLRKNIELLSINL